MQAAGYGLCRTCLGRGIQLAYMSYMSYMSYTFYMSYMSYVAYVLYALSYMRAKR